MEIPKIDIGSYIENLIRASDKYIGTPLDYCSAAINAIYDGVLFVISAPPPWLFILIIAVAAFFVMKRNRAAAIVFCLLLIWNLGLWEPTMATIALIIVSATVSLLIGIPLGTLAAEVERSKAIIMPGLDALHTLPRFVFLIPAITLFGIGIPAAVLATITLAVPPAARLTYLGLSSVNSEVIEAGRAHGCSRLQILVKIKFPQSLPTVLLGVNQCFMMCLNMVVICSLVGAGGLGADIVEALYALNLPRGVEAGVAIVCLAVVIDVIIGHYYEKSPITK